MCTFVTTQSQQLEQANARLQQAEAETAKAQARIAELEARMLKGGMAVPPGGLSSGDEPAAGLGTSQNAARPEPGRRRALSQAGTTGGQGAAARKNVLGGGHTERAGPQDGCQDANQADGPKVAAGRAQGMSTQGPAEPLQGKSASAARPDQSRSKAGKASPNFKSQASLQAVEAQVGGARLEDSTEDNDPATDEDAVEEVGEEPWRENELESAGTPSPAAEHEAEAFRRSRGASMVSPGANTNIGRQLKEMWKALQEKDDLIASMQQDMDEMSQALGAVFDTIEGSDSFSEDQVPSGPTAPGTMPDGTALGGRSRGSGGQRLIANVKSGKFTSKSTDKHLESTNVEGTHSDSQEYLAQAQGTYAHDNDNLDGLMSRPDDTAPKILSASGRPKCTSRRLAAGDMPAADGTGMVSDSSLSAAYYAGAGDIATPPGCAATASTSRLARGPQRVRSMQARAKRQSLTSAADVTAPGICPRCAELEKQLRYWRERAWFKKARNTRWAELRALRAKIPVSAGKFKGMLKMTDDLDSAGSLLGARRAGAFRRSLSAYPSRSRTSLSRGRSMPGGEEGLTADTGGHCHSQGATYHGEHASLGGLHTQQPLGDPQLPVPLTESDQGNASTGKAAAESSIGSSVGQATRPPAEATLRPGSSSASGPGAGGSSFVPFKETTRPTRTLTSTTTAARAISPVEMLVGASGAVSNTDDLVQRARLHALMMSTSAAPVTGNSPPLDSTVGQETPNHESACHSGADDPPDMLQMGQHGSQLLAHNTGCGPCEDVLADGKAAVTFAVSDYPPGSRERQNSPASWRGCEPGYTHSVSQPGCTSAAPGVAGTEQSQMHDELAEFAQPDEQSCELSLLTTAPEVADGGRDGRFEEPWDGVARVSAGSRGDNGKLQVGHTAPFGAPALNDRPDIGTPLAVGHGCSSSPGRRSTGNKLAKPVARERVEQKVDFASLALQGKRASVAPPEEDCRRSSPDRAARTAQQRLSAATGHVMNARRLIQAKPGAQLQSFKLCGAGVNWSKVEESSHAASS
eukprot:jgi/Ulvmu1/12868/UM098_0053.1